MKVLFGYRYLSPGGVETVLRTRLLGLPPLGVEATAFFLEDLGGAAAFSDCAERCKVGTPEQFAARARASDLAVVIDTPELFPGPACDYSTPWLLESHSSIPTSLGFLADPLARPPRALLVPSRTQAERVSRWLERTLPVLVAANPLGNEVLAPLGEPTACPPRPVLLTVGRLDEVKDWRAALAVARALHDAEVSCESWLVGFAVTETSELAATLAGLDLADRVRWLRSVPADQMPALYDLVRASGGLALSTSRTESVGLALLEAQARGLAVVAPHQPPFTEFLRDGETALLFPPADPQCAALCCAALLGDAERRQRLAARGRAAVVEAFAPSSLLPALAGALRRAARGEEVGTELALSPSSDRGDAPRPSPAFEEELARRLARGRQERRERRERQRSVELLEEAAQLEGRLSAARAEVERLGRDLAAERQDRATEHHAWQAERETVYRWLEERGAALATSEAERTESLRARDVLAEQSARQGAEIARLSAEVARLTDEGARLLGERERLRAAGERWRSEGARLAAEGERLQGELGAIHGSRWWRLLDRYWRLRRRFSRRPSGR